MKIKLRDKIIGRLKTEKGIKSLFEFIKIAKCENEMKKCYEAYHKNLARVDPFLSLDRSTASFKYHGVLFSVVPVFICFVFNNIQF